MQRLRVYDNRKQNDQLYMDRKTNVNVGTLLKELRRFESEYPDYDIACCMPDDT